MNSYTEQTTQLIDGQGRRITYLRVSMTDRCNFRCVYCMNEDVTFLPRQQLLSLEEIQFIVEVFAELGVDKIRLTGGEPLSRRNALSLVKGIGNIDAIKTLGITTNGSQLARYAQPLKDAGVNRLNISLDTLDQQRFKNITRTGQLSDVLAGIDAAIQAGIEHVKINAVIMKGKNDDEVKQLVDYVLQKNINISFIEEMPIGTLSKRSRDNDFISSNELRQRIQTSYPLMADTLSSGGPSRYFRIIGQQSLIGFISPHSENFCANCNRLRLTAEGQLLLCLGNENSIDLRYIIRTNPGDKQRLKSAILNAIKFKPASHHFDTDDTQIVRFMNHTGG